MEASRQDPIKKRNIRDVSCMAIDLQVGSGTFGAVFKATDTSTGESVALKRIKIENETQGFPITALREIRILKSLNHENIIKLKEVITYEGNDSENIYGFEEGAIFMVFEYCDFDLTGLMTSTKMGISSQQIRCYLKQLLSGVHHMHSKHIIHRDLKAPNLLITRNNQLKIADLGLSRIYTKNQRLTNRVVTLWYRAPELLLQTTKYGPEIDLWSIGCIFAEMCRNNSIFSGKDEAQQLAYIFQLCGTPDKHDEETLTRLSNCEGYATMMDSIRDLITFPQTCKIQERFASLGMLEVELLEKMLCLNPDKRISAKDALDADYFWSTATPTYDQLPLIKIDGVHEFEAKNRAEEKRKLEVEKYEQIKLARSQQQLEGTRGGRGGAYGRGMGRGSGRGDGLGRGRGGVVGEGKSLTNVRFKIRKASVSTGDEDDKKMGETLLHEDMMLAPKESRSNVEDTNSFQEPVGNTRSICENDDDNDTSRDVDLYVNYEIQLTHRSEEQSEVEEVGKDGNVHMPDSDK